jgi:hypothetical protein
MHLRRRIVLTTCALGLVAAAGAAVGIRSAIHEDTDEKVSLEQCPEAVQSTIRAQVGEGSITEIERTTDHGEVLYEVDAILANGRLEFDVAADGAFRGVENEDEADDEGEDGDGDEDGDVQVTLDQCPAAVVATIVEIVWDGAINEIERSPAGNYEVDAEFAEGSFEFVVGADGTYLGQEDDDAPDDDD